MACVLCCMCSSDYSSSWEGCKVKQYILQYWLPGQSKVLSPPQYAYFSSCKDLIDAILTAKSEGYEIEDIIIL